MNAPLLCTYAPLRLTKNLDHAEILDIGAGTWMRYLKVMSFRLLLLKIGRVTVMRYFHAGVIFVDSLASIRLGI